MLSNRAFSNDTLAFCTQALEVRLVAEEPDLVRAHLKARGADSADMLAAVEELGALTKERNALVWEGDQARGDRKRLSAEIGALLKAAGKGGGESNEAVVALKAEVEAANQVGGCKRDLLWVVGWVRERERGCGCVCCVGGWVGGWICESESPRLSELSLCQDAKEKSKRKGSVYKQT